VERKVRGVKELYSLLRLIKESGLFSSLSVLKLLEEETTKFLKARAEVSDGSVLYITEMHTGNHQKNSYHWQEVNGDLIMRWDNQPHWKNLITFPHHKHVGNETLPSHRITFEEVLVEIKKRLKK
jgi:hypothetical protein